MNLNMLLAVAAIGLACYLAESLTIAGYIEFDNGMKFRPRIGFGSTFGAIALLFATGLVGAWRGAIVSIGIWCTVYVVVPLLVVPGGPEAQQGDVLTVTTRGIELTLSEHWHVYWNRAPGTLVAARYSVARGWNIAPFDLLFPVFGWLVHRTLMRRSSADVDTLARRPGVHIELPLLHFRYMDKILVYPAGLILACASVLLVLYLYYLVTMIFY